MNTIKEGKAWPVYQAPMLSIKAQWQHDPKPFGCGYSCAIGDTVTAGEVPACALLSQPAQAAAPQWPHALVGLLLCDVGSVRMLRICRRSAARRCRMMRMGQMIIDAAHCHAKVLACSLHTLRQSLCDM